MERESKSFTKVTRTLVEDATMEEANAQDKQLTEFAKRTSGEKSSSQILKMDSTQLVSSYKMTRTRKK